jgi:hypothetical protein
MINSFQYFIEPPINFRGRYYIVPGDTGQEDGINWYIHDTFIPVYRYPNLDKPWLMRFVKRTHSTFSAHLTREEHENCEFCKDHGVTWAGAHSKTEVLNTGDDREWVFK